MHRNRPRSVALLVSLIVAAGVLSASAARAGSSWEITTSPNSAPLPTANVPSGATCITADDCWSVGAYRRGGIDQTLTQRWDGVSWRVVASPNSAPNQANRLREVTCRSASVCWAVGTFDDGSHGRTLTMRWDGTAWTIVPSPDASATSDNFLSGVACPTATMCWAVGSALIGSAYQSQFLRWDGSAWTGAASPNTSASESNVVNAVTCVSASECVAVGSATSGRLGERTWIARWNGAAWTLQASPNLGTGHNALYDVSCPAPSDCSAVGYAMVGNTQQTLILRWNGTAWSLAVSPNAGGPAPTDNFLRSISCATATSCWAVGHRSGGAGLQALVLRWDGSGWSLGTTPSVSSSHRLAAIGCAPTGACWSVGVATETIDQTLAFTWDGDAWQRAQTANAASDTHNTLLGVACPAPDDCWAVASHDNGMAQQTLIEHFDGTRWSIVPSPNTSAFASNILYDVDCVSRTACWAIGYVFTAGAFQTLTLRWDGVAWSRVASPSVGLTQNNFLHDVACAAVDDCWAVGFFDASSVYRTLALHWDGSAWTVAATPNIETSQQNRLYGVSCASAQACIAVGRYVQGNGILQTLALRWNGADWQVVASPNTSPMQANEFWRATCVSVDDCWAVGWDSLGSGTGRTLTQHWDGTAWSIVPSPNPPAPYSYSFLRSVACIASDDCWASGFYSLSGVHRTTLLHWDGTAWEVDASPNTSPTQSNVLVGLTCAADGGCWGVGYSTDDGAVFRTLIMQRRPENRPPIARVNVSSLDGVVPVSMTVDASSSSDPDLGDRVAAYRFDPGDGSPVVTQSGATLAHTFREPGRFTARVWALDTRGVMSAAPATIEVRAATPAPSIDTPTHEAIFGSTTVAVGGRAWPNRVVDLSGGGTLLGSFVSDAGGSWSGSMTLDEGAHTLTATVREPFGGSSAPSPIRAVTVDLTPPGAPTIVTPVEGGRVASRTVTIGGLSEPFAAVRLERAGSILATTTASASGSWSTVLVLADGAHAIRADQRDRAGNQGPIGPVRTFTVDAAEATTQILSPLANTILDRDEVTLSGRARPHAQLRVAEAGVSLAEITSDAAGAWAVTLRFAEGAHRIVVSDVATEEGDARSFVVTEGTPVIVAPTAGSLGPRNVRIDGASAPDATIAVREGSITLGVVRADPAGRWRLDLALADGRYEIVARVTNGAGSGRVSAPVGFDVDGTGPEVAGRADAWLMGARLGTPVRISGALLDARSVVRHVLVEYVDMTGKRVVGAPVCARCGADVTATFSDAPVLEPGRWTAVLRGVDALGNVGSPTSFAFVVGV